MENTQAEIREQILGEKAPIAWKERQRFFAGGSVICLSPDLDMVDVALRMHDDDHQAIQQWIDEGVLHKVTDEQAREWFASDATLLAVVVRPWVLVQEMGEELSQN